jgi:PKD repeat protein
MFMGIPLVVANQRFEVVCVPWRGDEYLPHPTWNGKEITLKGTVRYEGLVSWEWDFGDGTSNTGTATTTDDYPCPISAKHTYSGTVGTVYAAKLTVTAGGETKSDTYLVRIEERTRKVEADVAVDEGLWWLYQQQNRYTSDGIDFGYWYTFYTVAHTGAAVQAFENNLHKPFSDPSKDPYVDCVRRGLNYLTLQMHKVVISAGDGDTNGNGFGLTCHHPGYSGCEMYEIGIAMMAIVSSDTPGCVVVAGEDGVVGRTYREIVQDMADFCAYAQNGPETGFYEGGWRYSRNYGTSDNSVTQWPIIGMEPAEAKSEWGIKVADFVKPRLEGWLNRTQCEATDWRFGGFGYTSAYEWVNIAKTAGTGIPGLLFCGVPETDSRIVNAINFIDTNWASDNFGNGYAMYAVMKAFEEFLHKESTGSHIWWDEYVDYLIPLQYADGHWETMAWSYSPHLTTAWMVMILTKVVYDIPPTAVAKVNGFDEVEVDKDQIVNFDGSQSREGTYKIVKYEWDWESDGIYDAEGMTVTHSYTEYGTYTVTLKVTDNRDIVTGGKKAALSDTDTCIVHVHPPPHPPIADANGPYIGWVGVPVTLNGSGSWDPNEPPFGNDEIVAWNWDLDNDGEFDDASGKIIQYTWNKPGTYPIALWVKAKEEPYDCEEPSRTMVEIGNHDPVAHVNGPYETWICHTITLDGSGSYDPDEPVGDRIVSYEWDLDNDGEYDDAFVVNPEFHKDTEGVYTVRLKVTDTFGATDTDWTTVVVKKVEEWSFAIITDLHIGRGYPDYGPEGFDENKRLDDSRILHLCQDYYLTERLERVVKVIKEEFRVKHNIKFVAVLGDISDSGEYSELLKAKSILDGLNVDVDGDGKYEMVYVPLIGNHDVWPKVRDGKGKEIKSDKPSTFFHDVFHSQFNLIKESFTETFQGPDGVVHMNYAFALESLKFICLDFVDRRSPDYGAAFLYGETKKWLIDHLKEEEPTVLFSHHPMIGDSELALLGESLFGGDVWESIKKYWRAEFGAFEDADIKELGELVKDSKTKMLANFAGHIHGRYTEYPKVPEELIFNPYFMDANRVYKEWYLGYGSIPIVTTEALMVGSNEPEPKAVIRIVKIKGGEIENFDIFEGEVTARALNPYFKQIDVELRSTLKWPPWKWVIEVEAYAFTKRFTKECPGTYILYIDGVKVGEKQSKTWKSAVQFEFEYKGDKNYDFRLVVKGTTPDGREEIVENINQTRYLKRPPFVVGAFSPVDVIVIDPDGLMISKEINEIPGATYSEDTDYNGDGELDDIIIIPNRKVGDYFITVIPEPEANPTDTYTLLIWPETVDEPFVLAESVQVCNIPTNPYIVRSTQTEVIPIIPATINFDPDTLNLKSKGKWVTVYIELPMGHGYDVGMINLTSIMLDGRVYVEIKPTEIGDHDGDGVPDLMVKFDRTVVQNILNVGDKVGIIISGTLIDGRLFEGKDAIKVILST